MRQMMVYRALSGLVALALSGFAQTPAGPGDSKTVSAAESNFRAPANYVLGPEDQISVWAFNAEEINGKPYTLDHAGDISMPMIGRLHVAGMTVKQVEGEIASRLTKYIRHPQVVVSVTDFRSQPVSVLGAVASPGIYQLRGRKTLLEILTLAGGLKPDAGTFAKIMRRLDRGRIPLPGASDDPSGEYSVAEVNVKTLMASETSEQDIALMPNDLISVPTAQTIYVIGQVAKPGTYPLSERNNMTVLQALTLAGGANSSASLKNARILRPIMGGPKRAELPVNLKAILSGKASDFPILANDILFIPDDLNKRISGRVIETAIQSGTWMLTWGIVH